MNIWPYIAAAVFAAIILTLAVIWGYEVYRNTQYWARERRIKRYNAERSTQSAKEASDAE